MNCIMSSNVMLVQSEGKFNNDFKVKQCIGNGSYGCVYQVKQKSDKTIHAIKKIKFDSNYFKYFGCLFKDYLRFFSCLVLRN